MKTPICDFVKAYAQTRPHRLHMPGHKGVGPLGVEERDITEIGGADSLYEASGIIRESEKNASQLFGARTFYSTEGSSLCVRAMLYLACLHAAEEGRQPRIAAGRNAHKSFLTAAACLDFAIQWLYPSAENAYLSCPLTADDIEAVFEAEEKPTAVYITSPDYLGNTVDVAAIAAVCRRHGALLLVDNAHGAYQKFLPNSCHP
ncbi:MAG: amino acid decarboxylase, partial [Clostridia bacterium]|nr:amino acid decarboxylase [Clostridia bacterium]